MYLTLIDTIGRKLLLSNPLTFFRHCLTRQIGLSFNQWKSGYDAFQTTSWSLGIPLTAYYNVPQRSIVRPLTERHFEQQHPFSPENVYVDSIVSITDPARKLKAAIIVDVLFIPEYNDPFTTEYKWLKADFENMVWYYVISLFFHCIDNIFQHCYQI